MSKTKRILRIISLIMFIGYLTSCENDQDEIITTGVSEISKTELDPNEKNKGEKSFLYRGGCSNDNIKPVIKCKNTVLWLRVGSNMPDFISRKDVTATDNCGIASLTQYPPYGTSIRLGAQPITITAIDKNGNRASCNNIVVIAKK